MKEQPHYTDLLTEDFFIEHYNKRRMSFPKIAKMLRHDGHNIAVATVHRYAKQLGIGRNASEAKRNQDDNPLDYSVSFMTETTLEAIDGFLLGDGHIQIDSSSLVDSGRASCALEHGEFRDYLIAPFHRYSITTFACKHKSSPQGFYNHGQTKFHPDLFVQHKRWYPDGGTKQPPDDVRITPLSVMMWYLGDGSVVQQNNTVMLRLSTDGFSKERVEFLAERLNGTGIACHRNGDNRIQVDARGIPAFYEFIGTKSPVSCYDYKFDLPEWRFEAKRMREVADELGIDYNRLSYLVKIGRVPCYRATQNGKPRFLPEHIEKLRNEHAILFSDARSETLD